MPIKTSRDPKTGKLTYKYEAPKGGLKRSKRLDAKDLGINVPKTNVKPPKSGSERFNTQFNTGGRYYDDRNPDPLDFASPRLNPTRAITSFFGLKPGIDRAMDAKQIERLKQYPELRSDQYIQSLKRVADAGATGGFNFDALFSPTDPRVSQTDRCSLQSQDMVLANQADPTSGVLEGGALSDADIINKVGDNVVDAPLVFAADNYADTTLGGIKDATGTANLDAQINETYRDNSDVLNQMLLNKMSTDGGQTTPSSYTAINPYLEADTTSYEERRVSNPYATTGSVTTDNVGTMYAADNVPKYNPMARVPAQLDYQNMFPNAFQDAALALIDPNDKTRYFENIVPRERATRGLLGGLPFSVDVSRFNPVSLAGMFGGNTALQNLANRYYNVNLVGNRNIPYSERDNFLNVGNLGIGYTPTGGLLTRGQQEAMLRERFGEFQKGYPDYQSYQLGIY